MRLRERPSGFFSNNIPTIESKDHYVPMKQWRQQIRMLKNDRQLAGRDAAMKGEEAMVVSWE
jgi:hypothetical protein